MRKGILVEAEFLFWSETAVCLAFHQTDNVEMACTIF
jgi:hypothetical protein